MAQRESVDAIYSKLNERTADILKRGEYIKDFIVNDNDGKKTITIFLYYVDKEPAIRGVKIISKPGRRIYLQVKDIKPVLGGLGMSIVSTPKGLMTDNEARSKRVGGELLFQVW